MTMVLASAIAATPLLSDGNNGTLQLAAADAEQGDGLPPGFDRRVINAVARRRRFAARGEMCYKNKP